MSYSVTDKDLDFSKWKVADLKKELKMRGLSTEGKKNDLVVRLQLAIGGSNLLDDTVNDQDELLDEDVLTDEDGDTLEESDIIKSDTPENISERSIPNVSLKRKANDNENQKQPTKKIILNRNVPITTEVNKVEGKENKSKMVSETTNKIDVRVGSLTPKERLERRAAKFGLAMSNEAKMEARALRFNLPVKNSKYGGVAAASIEVLKSRAERFGTTQPGSILEKAEIEEKRRMREARFGKVEAVSSTFRPKSRTWISVAEHKKQLRAERFKIKA